MTRVSTVSFCTYELLSCLLYAILGYVFVPDCLQHLLPHRDAVLRALLRLSILAYTFAAILFSLLCYSFHTRLTYEEVPCAWPVSFKHPRIN